MSGTPRGVRLAVRAALVAALVPAAQTSAQGVRITGSSVVQYVEVRPLVPDSIPASSAGDTVPGSVGDLRFGPDGQIVRCLTGLPYCGYRRTTAPVAGLPLVQDVAVSAWGLAQGLRAYAHVRGRASVGNADQFWPQVGDPVDLLDAYLELDRGAFRARAGRQWHTSGLGYYNFDGAALLWRAPRGATLEGYAGWSLERGLNEPQTSDELAALEPFAPSSRAYIFGAQARWRPGPRFSGSAIYQRELRTDRAGLYSERAAADAQAHLLGASLSGQFVYDVAQTQVNEARLRLRLPPWRRTSVTLEARHHAPFFELWTIWGAFSPVGFDEVSALASWIAPVNGLQISLGGARRRYNDPDAGFPTLELTRNGWRFTASGAWQAGPHWSARAGYEAEVGFGTSRTDQSLSLRRLLPHEGYAGLSLQAFQNAYDFRITDGRVLGLGGELGFALGSVGRVDGNLYYLDHVDHAPESPDWSQVRGSVQLSWTVGTQAGARIRGARGAP